MFKPRAFALCALFAALAVPAHATDVALATSIGQSGYGDWQTFNVSDIDSRSFGVEWIDNANTNAPGFGTALDFTFTIHAGSTGTLTVVDTGFAGDTFKLTNFGNVFGGTGGVPSALYDGNAPSVADFDTALANASFSRGSFMLGAGSYRISGALDQSVMLDAATPLNLLPVSMFCDLGRAPCGPAGPAQPPTPAARMPVDETYERGLKAALQVLGLP